MHAPASAINKKALAYYLTYQFVPKPFSLNHAGPPRTEDYKFPRTLDPKKTFRHDETRLAENLYALLTDIIKTSLKQTTGPIGLLLSGGLDSTILLHLLRKNTRRNICTISAAYDSDRSHLKLCASLAKKYNAIHQELIITPAHLRQLARIYSPGLDNPIGDNGLLANYLMFNMLSSRTKLIYAGDGADCLFHGLNIHYLDFLDKNYLHRLKKTTDFPDAVHRRILLPKAHYPDFEHYKFDEIFLTKNEAHQYLGMDFDLSAPLRSITKTIKTNDPIKKTILLDLNFLVNNRVDYILKSAAANKIKIILPYLDSALIDYALRIPSSYFIKDLEQKYILKKAFENALPKEVISQKKRGMTPPFLDWYLKNRSFVLKTMLKATKLGVAPEYIRYLTDNINRSNQYAYGMRIWLVLNLVLWSAGQQTPDKTHSI
ncbi:MAG: asparagine synthase [Candidatus Omnitrophica bacterium]|nr:asparagine synthase [Candidatus Omnitrophota bacterium]